MDASKIADGNREWNEKDWLTKQGSKWVSADAQKLDTTSSHRINAGGTLLLGIFGVLGVMNGV